MLVARCRYSRVFHGDKQSKTERICCQTKSHPFLSPLVILITHSDNSLPNFIPSSPNVVDVYEKTQLGCKHPSTWQNVLKSTLVREKKCALFDRTPIIGVDVFARNVDLTMEKPHEDCRAKKSISTKPKIKWCSLKLRNKWSSATPLNHGLILWDTNVMNRSFMETALFHDRKCMITRTQKMSLTAIHPHGRSIPVAKKTVQ